MMLTFFENLLPQKKKQESPKKTPKQLAIDEVNALTKKLAELLEAVKAGDLLTVNQLLEDPNVERYANVDEDLFLHEAIQRNYDKISSRLLKIDQVRQSAADLNNMALILAVDQGNLPLLKMLLSIPKVRQMLVRLDDETLVTSIKKAQYNIFTELLKYKEVRLNIAARENLAFRKALNFGDYFTIKRLFDFELVRLNAAANNNSALMYAVEKGYTSIVELLLGEPTVYRNAAVLDNRALITAIKKDFLNIFKLLLDVDAVRENAHCVNNKPLYLAVAYGNLPMVHHLLKIPLIAETAGSLNNYAIMLAAENNHYVIILKLLTVRSICLGIHSQDNWLLRWAVSNKQPDIVKKLLILPKVRENAHALMNQALQIAVENGDLHIVNKLLRIPIVRAHAAVKKNNAIKTAVDYNYPKIVEKLLEIPMVQETAAADSNYILRWAACYGYIKIVNRLLAIDAVCEMADVNDNEALQYAIKGDHYEIVDRLLLIPAVTANAAIYNNFFYRLACENEFWDIAARLMQEPSVNEYLERESLASLAAYSENSMRMLSQKQNDGFNAIKARYTAEYEKRGKHPKIFEELLNSLQEKLKPLSLSFDPLADQRKYYQNIYHTTYRYLSLLPNDWMSSEAELVERDKEGKGWAIITDEQREKIAYLWLLVNDFTFPLPEGFSQADLIDHFIRDLSLVARAHNWDKSRIIINSKTGEKNDEYYDDGEGDKPSCSAGVNQRVIQMLEVFLANFLPDFRPLSPNIIKAYFKSQFISEAGDESYFNRIQKLSESELISVKHLFNKYVIEYCGETAELSKEEGALLNDFEPNKEQVESFLIDCQKRFVPKRITEKLMPLLFWQGMRFQSYEDVIYYLAKNAIIIFYNELNTKIEERIKSFTQILPEEVVTLTFSFEKLKVINKDEVVNTSSSLPSYTVPNSTANLQSKATPMLKPY